MRVDGLADLGSERQLSRQKEERDKRAWEGKKKCDGAKS